ncbi:hypothetical protein BG015_005856 [Linnemannia schmuckeri]|uniref:Uncharacterized protein n=1 Tax=Linnemannia schmuckeri TaxID=64567 RepID=A0A9P5VC50_9FUNG|nr:hypothetical protein BG015_005856 [Linnemannia schmuckeri]
MDMIMSWFDKSFEKVGFFKYFKKPSILQQRAAQLCTPMSIALAVVPMLGTLSTAGCIGKRAIGKTNSQWGYQVVVISIGNAPQNRNEDSKPLVETGYIGYRLAFSVSLDAVVGVLISIINFDVPPPGWLPRPKPRKWLSFHRTPLRNLQELEQARFPSKSYTMLASRQDRDETEIDIVNKCPRIQSLTFTSAMGLRADDFATIVGKPYALFLLSVGVSVQKHQNTLARILFTCRATIKSFKLRGITVRAATFLSEILEANFIQEPNRIFKLAELDLKVFRIGAMMAGRVALFQEPQGVVKLAFGRELDGFTILNGLE